jgi:hypothetical protein
MIIGISAIKWSLLDYNILFGVMRAQTSSMIAKTCRAPLPWSIVQQMEARYKNMGPGFQVKIKVCLFIG